MSWRPEEVFDHCLDVYKVAFEECFVKHHLGAVDASAFAKRGWKPDRKARLEDYVADFSLAGRSSLERAGLHSRVILFEVFYAGCAPYDRARMYLGLSEMGWVRWTEQIRNVVGKELMERRIFPPREYFEK